MESVVPRPGKVEIGFTDDRLTGTGGAAFLAHAAERLGLLPRLAEAVSVKQRARGASDAETQWSLVASLAAGNGSLSDVDALRGDGVQRELPGLPEAPSSRRLGEFPRRLTKWDVERLEEVLRHLSASLAPAVVEHETAERGYVPVFVDGTGIEVDGRLFEHAARLYTGERVHGTAAAPGRRRGVRLEGAGIWRRCCRRGRRCGCGRPEFVEYVSSGAGTTR